MIKTIIAYFLILTGTPLIIGQIAILAIAFLLELIIGERWKRIPSILFEPFSGFIAGVTMFWIFHWLNVRTSILAPLLLSILVAIWFTARNERSAIVPNLAGIALGWYICT
jgi:hypothetical protein